MSVDRTLWHMLPWPVRRFPADLVAVVFFTSATIGAVLLPGVNETPLRVILGLPFALFFPGYAFIAALFPEAADHSPPETTSEETAITRLPRLGDGIDGLERAVLSFGLSIAITPLIGLIFNFSPWGIRLVPIVFAIATFILPLSVVAAVRRWNLPADERFAVPYHAWLSKGRTELLQPDTRLDALLNVMLVLSLLLAVGSVGWAVAVQKQGEAFTEFYLLTEQENGTLVADEYPTEFTQGQGKSLFVGIENHEHEPISYTVVVELQRIQIMNNTTTVIEEQELRRFTPVIGANETWREEHTVTPTLTGTRLRLVYLLYKERPPANPSVATADQELHLWVNVTAH